MERSLQPALLKGVHHEPRLSRGFSARKVEFHWTHACQTSTHVLDRNAPLRSLGYRATMVTPFPHREFLSKWPAKIDIDVLFDRRRDCVDYMLTSALADMHRESD